MESHENSRLFKEQIQKLEKEVNELRQILGYTDEMMLVVDIGTRTISQATPAFLERTKLASGEIINKPVDSFIDEVTLEFFNKKVQNTASANGNSGYFLCQWKFVRKKPEIFLCQFLAGDSKEQIFWRFFPLKLPTGRGRWGSRFHETIFDSISDIIGILDLEYNVLIYNSAGYRFWGKKPEQLVGKKCYELLGKETPCEICVVKTVYRTKKSARVVKYVTEFDIWLDARVYPIVDGNGKMIAVIEHLQNVTSEANYKNALRESEEKYRNLIELSNDAIFLVENDKLNLVNKKFAEMTGYTREEILAQGFDWKKIIAPESLPYILERRRKIKQDQPVDSIYEVVIQNKKGEKFICEVSMHRYRHGEKTIVQGVVRDITERKRLEEKLRENEHFLNAVFEGIQDGVSVLDKDLNIIRVNQWMKKRYFHEKNFAGRKCYEVYQNRSEPCTPCPSLRTLETGEMHVEIVKYRIAENEKGWMELSTYPMFDANGKIVGVIESVKDVTERKRDAERIKKSLREKEILLREIHHRVKNNLQVISGLLRIQAKELKDETAREAFEQSRQRIFSMALVHDKLYRSQDFSAIQLDKYIETMAKNVLIANNLNRRIELIFNLEPADLPLDKAVPLGLILNEILTNAIKYAFPDSKKGKVKFCLKKKGEGNLEIIIKDNGVGLPENIAGMEEGTLGMQLIKLLVDQIEGKLTINSIKGTEYILRFSV